MICNKDCFACAFPDCINDEMDAADRRESRERDKLLGVPRREKCSESAAAEEHRRRPRGRNTPRRSGFFRR